MAAPDPRAEETRSRLVAAGLELFGRRGFEAVTTRQLAEAAGVNQAAIPYHFGGKEGVYRAVVEHIAQATSAQVAPIVATARRRLERQPTARETGDILLEATLAIARAVFAPEHGTAWFSFLGREQYQPTAAFERLHEAFAKPAHELVAELLGRLAGMPPTAPETILLAQAYLGPIIGFASARTTLNRRLGRDGDLGPAEIEAAIDAIGRISQMTIRGMRR